MKYIRILVTLTLFLSAVTQADTLYENAEVGNTNHWLIFMVMEIQNING